jgi:hypothetical protein
MACSLDLSAHIANLTLRMEDFLWINQRICSSTTYVICVLIIIGIPGKQAIERKSK